MDLTDYRPPTEHAKVNQFAIRCFRDTGDGDYVAARMSLRARLGTQFLWSAEQAIEKYLKCILMLNRRDTSDLGHRIDDALNRINTQLPFQIKLSKPEQKIFDHVCEWGADRYLIGSYELMDKEVANLDLLVWRLRQYCQPLDVLHYADTPTEAVLLANIKRIENGMSGPPKNGHLPHGVIEHILASKQHPAREPLVWKNFRYCERQRKVIWYSSGFHTVNAPLWLDPGLADEAAKWMKIPPSIVRECRMLVEERKRTGEQP